jgi:hypothetical protein
MLCCTSLRHGAVVETCVRWVSNSFMHCRCGPCKTIAPVVDQLATIHPTVQFFKLDIDKCKVRVAFYWLFFHLNFLPDDQDDDGCLVCALVCVHECRQGGLSLLRRKPEGCAVIVNCRLQFALIFLYTARGALAAACHRPGIHGSSR